MGRTRKTSGGKPKFEAGRMKVRAHRGPDDQGRWCWRGVVYEGSAERTVWSARWLTPKEAEREASAAVSDGAIERPRRPKEVAPRPEGVSAADPRTLMFLLRAYLAQEVKPRREKGTHTAYKSRARVFKRHFGDRYLTEALDYRALTEFRNARLAAEIKPKTVNFELIFLRAAWKWGQKLGYAPRRELDLPEVDVPEDEIGYTPPLAGVLPVLERVSPLVHDVMRVQLATGARISEIAALRREDIDPDEWMLTLGRHELARKTGAREVPLDDPDVIGLLRARLASLPDHEPRLWGLSMHTVRDRAIDEVRGACDAANVPRWTTHAIRRFVIDRLCRRGVDSVDAARLLGMSLKTLEKHYRTITPEDKRAAVRKARLGALDEVGAEVVQLRGTRTR